MSRQSSGADRLVQVWSGGTRWLVHGEHRDHLLGPDGLRLEEWLRTGHARPVKHGPHRVVYRVELPGLPFYLKHNLLPDARAWLRQWIRPSKARLEYERALAVAARGVPTIVPLALGERRSRPWPQDSFLVTHSLTDAVALNVLIENHLPLLPRTEHARQRRLLAVALGRFMARLHEAGLVHRDLHCGNILARVGADGAPSLYLVDLQEVRLRRPLDWQASRANLVLLNRWLVQRTTRADRLRFWRAYARARWHTQSPQGRARDRDRARELEIHTRASNEYFWRHRDRRCLETNRYFRPVRAPGVIGHAVTDLDRAALATLLAHPDEPFERAGIRLLKNSRSSTVAELEVIVSGRPCAVIYKRFRVTGRADPWANLVRTPPALRSWIWGNALRERGVPTARPLLVFYRRQRGLLREGYLLTEKITDAVDLRGFIDSLAAMAPARRRVLLRQRIEELARLVRNLHARYLCHRDLKAANVLLKNRAHQRPTVPASPSPASPGASTPGPDPNTPLWLIDLVGVTRHRRVPRQKRLQNLARLNASFWDDDRVPRTDRLRFLRVYLEWGIRGREGWKGWWREIEKATCRKAARNAASGRPLA